MKYFHRRLRKVYKDLDYTLEEASIIIGDISLPYFERVLKGQYIKNRKKREAVEGWIRRNEKLTNKAKEK